MASADFEEDADAKRPTVQVGDPFTEKLLIEACLELMATDAIVAIQDMGAAGLTSSSVEMATNGKAGIRLDMDKVPCREEGMTPYEMMLSESQERMLMVLKPGKEAMAAEIFEKWELDFAVIGEVTDTRHMVLEFGGEVVCDIPLGPLAADAPEYERPYVSKEEYKAWAGIPSIAKIPDSEDYGTELLHMLASPALASRRWIWEQYDSQVGADTMQKSGGDSAVVRVHGTDKALAITTDCNPRYCYADPYEGGKQAIAEAYRNLNAVGARPLAVTNCLNFANPQRPEIMAQFVGCLEGMGEACRALDFPIVSGNVSLYNESKATGGGSAILPTPAIGGVGILEDQEDMASIPFKDEGHAIIVLGGFTDNGDVLWNAKSGEPDLPAMRAEGSIGTIGSHLGQSTWLREIRGMEDGAPPPTDLATERKVGEFVRNLIESARCTAVHDLSDGGAAVALAEMCMASGIGATVHTLGDALLDMYGEDQSRYIVTMTITEREEWEAFKAECDDAGVSADWIGFSGGKTFSWKDDEDRILFDVPIEDMRAANDSFFKNWMED